MMHLILTTRLNGAHHLAPIGSKPQRILDIGCGTGKFLSDGASADVKNFIRNLRGSFFPLLVRMSY